MVGIYLCLYAKRSLIKRISQIETDTVKTGLGGTLGNKGAALLKMQIDDT
jgi:phosphatidylinositol-bisphosphatase